MYEARHGRDGVGPLGVEGAHDMIEEEVGIDMVGLVEGKDLRG